MQVSKPNFYSDILSIKKVLVLADESSFYKIGGLFQLNRILLNIVESLTKNEDSSLARLHFFIYWKQDMPEKKRISFKHPALKNILIDMSDNAQSVEHWLHLEEKLVLVIKTNLVLGRGSLKNLLKKEIFQNNHSLDSSSQQRSPYFLILKVSKLQRDYRTKKKYLWENLCNKFQSAKDVGLNVSEKSGFYENLEKFSDIKDCEQRLFRSLSKPSDGLVAKYLNRPISTRISRFLVPLPITPNHWTFLLFGVFLIGIWALTWGTQMGFILGMFLYQSVSLLDGCDGELARVRFEESKLGEWADTLSDLAGNLLFVFALGLGLSRQEGIDSFKSIFFFWEGVICAFAMACTLWGVHCFTQKRESTGHFNNFGKTIIQELMLTGWAKNVSFFIVKILKRNTYALLFFIMSLFGQTDWILHLLGIGVLIHLMALFRSRLLWKDEEKNAMSEKKT